MSELRSRPLFSITLNVLPIQPVGAGPLGTRRIIPISGGSFEGDRLRGIVLPQAAGDWLLDRADGSSQQDARLTLQTDDGALIFMSYRGVRFVSPEVSARIARGERVDASEYYHRVALFFETASERYGWLNRIVSVGVGDRTPTGVSYRVFEVL